MINNIKYYISLSYNPHENLAVEQYLMESVPSDTCILYLWQNQKTVVIGRNQNPWKECRTEELSGDGGYLARRLSGGGAVFHDLGNLNFTFLVSKQNYDLKKQMSVIAKACEHFHIPVTLSGRNDVLADGRKFSGNAYYDTKGQAYHHGTLLIDVDMARLSKYLRPSKAKLSSKGVDSVTSRVINLRELCHTLTIADMKESMIHAFEEVYGLSPVEISESEFDTTQIQTLSTRNSSWEWLYGRKIPFTFQCSKRFDWGELDLDLQIEKGLIQNLSVYSDSMDWTYASAIHDGLVGCRLDACALKERIHGLLLPDTVQNDLLSLLQEQTI